jgi:hypothetical protein
MIWSTYGLNLERWLLDNTLYEVVNNINNKIGNMKHLIQLSRVLLEKPIIAQLVQKIHGV